jgi:hypothetical protein
VKHIEIRLIFTVSLHDEISMIRYELPSVKLRPICLSLLELW